MHHVNCSLVGRGNTWCVPSLNTWNSLEDDIIAQLLHQLLQLYKRYQLEKLENDDVLQFVYESLLKTLSIGEGDIEVSVGNQGSQYSSLLVRLPLSLQDVPPVLVDANTGPATSLLHVTFQGTEGVFVPKLHLSPRIESLIGGASTLALPAVPPGACLMDYVERILQLLEQRVRKAVLSFEMRKQFVAQIKNCRVTELSHPLPQPPPTHTLSPFTVIDFLTILLSVTVRRRCFRKGPS
ncbi:BRCA1-A complex subunit BRE [Penaeus vannamei]|uniref:BRISC and BRCA1-A complex member 2 n=1 Tax=Penaeus vannamei TaxID=6689 RepID=A0A3R7N8Q7_PENVA|nr:BRCA1-A complex subunit BRE [Penaeus vannamei]